MLVHYESTKRFYWIVKKSVSSLKTLTDKIRADFGLCRGRVFFFFFFCKLGLGFYHLEYVFSCSNVLLVYTMTYQHAIKYRDCNNLIDGDKEKLFHKSCDSII